MGQLLRGLNLLDRGALRALDDEARVEPERHDHGHERRHRGEVEAVDLTGLDLRAGAVPGQTFPDCGGG